jgi:acyl-CoA hydrolase
LPELVHAADKIVVEINTRLPLAYEGLHDIISPKDPKGMSRPITNIRDRIGSPYIQIDPSKIIGIVENNAEDNTPDSEPADAISRCEES